MFETNPKASLQANATDIDIDMKTLVGHAQSLFQAAAALTGEKADEARERGMRLLDDALAKAREAQADAMAAGREIAASSDAYVRENPWGAIVAAAGAGLLIGVIVGRR